MWSLEKYVEIIIRKLKNDNAYKFKTRIPTKSIIALLNQRGSQYLRGFILKPFLNKSKGPLFKGSGVKIVHKYLLQVGRSCIIENNVYMDCISKNGIILKDNVTIAKQAILQCTGVISNLGIGITIGSNSAVGAQSFLGGQGGITIGDNVIIGPNVKIFSENHNYSNPEIPIRLQGENRKGVLIENDCWIGAGTIILDGVTVRSGTVIAAGSVVTKSNNKNTIIGGVPAKLIRPRCDS